MTRIEKVKKALEMGLMVFDEDQRRVISDTGSVFRMKDTPRVYSHQNDCDNWGLDGFTIGSIPIDQWQPEPPEPTWTEAEIREAFKFSRLAYQEPSISIENYVDGLIGDIIDNLKEKQS